jgi:hypothetical protein
MPALWTGLERREAVTRHEMQRVNFGLIYGDTVQPYSDDELDALRDEHRLCPAEACTPTRLLATLDGVQRRNRYLVWENAQLGVDLAEVRAINNDNWVELCSTRDENADLKDDLRVSKQKNEDRIIELMKLGREKDDALKANREFGDALATLAAAAGVTGRAAEVVTTVIGTLVLMREDLKRSYVSQETACAIHDMLVAAGMGRARNPNTLFDMVKEIIATLEHDHLRFGAIVQELIDALRAALTALTIESIGNPNSQAIGRCADKMRRAIERATKAVSDGSPAT